MERDGCAGGGRGLLDGDVRDDAVPAQNAEARVLLPAESGRRFDDVDAGGELEDVGAHGRLGGVARDDDRRFGFVLGAGGPAPWAAHNFDGGAVAGEKRRRERVFAGPPFGGGVVGRAVGVAVGFFGGGGAEVRRRMEVEIVILIMGVVGEHGVWVVVVVAVFVFCEFSFHGFDFSLVIYIFLQRMNCLWEGGEMDVKCIL